MVATQNTINESISQKIKKGFHAKYLTICKTKNIQPLPEVKTKQKNIYMVDFHADRVRVYDWLAISGALEHDKTLHSFAVRLRKNDGMVFEEIDSLKKSKLIVSHPVIYSKFILMEFLNALQSMLSLNSHIELLTLEGIPIYGRYMTHLAKGLCSNRSLKVLNLARSNMGDEACEILCSNIKHLTNIEHVNLSQCNLTIKGVNSIRDFIRFQKIHRFSEAWIRSLRYQSVDATSFDGVKKIYLNNNPRIGDEGLEMLTDELREDVWIKEIEMQNCGLTDVGANHIMNCLQINKTILNFNVNNNPEIPEHFHRHMLICLGGSSGGDGESSDSSDMKTTPQKITKSQLMDNLKFVEDQLESEIFRRKELEKLNEQLHRQISEIQEQISMQNSVINVPEGYTLVTNEELQKIMIKKSTIIAHKTYSNAAVKLRRRKKTLAIKKAQSSTADIMTEPELLTKKSHNAINIDVTPKRMYAERKMSGYLDIGGAGDNADDSIHLLHSFVKCKEKSHINQINDEFDPRMFFNLRNKNHVVPSNSDAESDV